MSTPAISTASPPRREGSPFRGLGTVFLKESADHLSSVRMHLVMVLVLLTAFGSIYSVIGDIRKSVGEDPFLFLNLFSISHEPLPSFVGFLGFLVPLLAIALGFDAINSEYARRTMSRLLAQPIYRDALLLGKFLAGMFTLTIAMVALWLLMTGFGILMLGLPPSGEEVARGLAFLVVTIFYGGVWLALAMLLSIIFSSAATSALTALSIWLFFAVFWPMLAPMVASAIVPLDMNNPMTAVTQYEWSMMLARISPNTLFAEATIAILDPATRALGPVFSSQLIGAIRGAPLPIDQSLVLVWPQVTGLIAVTILVFCAAYVTFQRQEVRA
jgi:ABC-2 type transport system permease protein